MRFGVLFKKHFDHTDRVIKILNDFGCDFTLLDKEFPKNIDFIICFGGDGTVLRSVPFALRYNVPIVGFNFGKVGYLLNFEFDDFEKVIKILKEGKFTLDTRKLLEVKAYQGEQVVFNGLALNDAVVFKTVTEKLIYLKLNVDKGDVYEAACDGMIISTPTGSTAYSLAAGGVIISPKVPAIITTPITPQVLNIRPMVYADSETIEVKLLKFYPATLIVDGVKICELNPNDRVVVKKAKEKIRFVTGEKPC